MGSMNDAFWVGRASHVSLPFRPPLLTRSDPGSWLGLRDFGPLALKR